MKLIVPLATSFVLMSSALGRADVVWDTLSGSAGQSLRFSYENIGLGTQWVSVATPVDLASAGSVTSLSVVGQHLRNDGAFFTPTSYTGSDYSINVWSSPAAFLANPLQGDAWTGSGGLTVASTGTFSGGNTPLLRFDFQIGGSLVLPAGTSYVGVQSKSFPVNIGAFAWADSSSSAPVGSRVQYQSPGTLAELPRPMSLRIDAQPVPEPASLLVLGSSAALLLKRRRSTKPIATSGA